MKSLKMILGIALSATSLGAGVAFAAVSNYASEEKAQVAEAGSSNYKIVGYVQSLSLSGFSYASGAAMTNGGSDNIAYLKHVKLTAGDVFKLTDNSNWLGYNNRDGYGIEANSDYFYYAAQANKLWTGTNLFWKSDNKTCTGSWGTTGTDSFIDGGNGHITVQMKTPQYDYSGTYWTTGSSTTWIEMNDGTHWSSASAKKATSGNIQTWEFEFDLDEYTSFKFLRCGTSYTTIDYWGAETDSFSCENVFSSDKNMYVRKTGWYDIYINNSGKIYMEDSIQRWIDNNMHLSDYTEEKGWCNDAEHNYYENAKTELLKLGSDAVAYFQGGTDSKYSAALERYNKWAAAAHDNSPFASSLRVLNAVKNNNGAVALSLICVSIISTMTIVYFVIRKKKKHQ